MKFEQRAAKTMIQVGLVMAIGVSNFAAAKWMPPENPNPMAILQESQKDLVAKRYEDAFDKLMWFRDNATKINPALGGVRNSFTVQALCRMESEYAPAKKQVDTMRAKAAEIVESGGPQAVQGFITLVLVDRHRGDGEKTVEVFDKFARTNKALAPQLFTLVESDIVNAERFDLVEEYLDPNLRFRMAEMNFDGAMQRSDQAANAERMKETIGNHYKYQVTSTVALLAKINRKEDAETYHKKATEYWAKAAEKYGVPSDALEEPLEKALKGEIPKSPF